MIVQQHDVRGPEAEPSVGSVAVLFHVPPRDPTPGKGSQLGDRKEAALVEGWLADLSTRALRELVALDADAVAEA